MCVCVRVCIVRFGPCGTTTHTPAHSLGPETESAHDSKRRNRTSENAESIDSPRSAWCMGEAEGAVAGRLDLWLSV